MSTDRRQETADMLARRARYVDSVLDRVDRPPVQHPSRRRADTIRDRLLYVLVLTALASVATVVCAWSMR